MKPKFFRFALCFCTLFALMLIFSVPPVSADTTVGGIISVDTTWTAAGSPYIVTSNIAVQGTDGADGITTLTIEPGAELRFAAGLGLQVGYTSGAPGALVAQGTSTNPIVFTSNQASPAPGNWSGLYFYDTADDASRLEHCIVRYSGSLYGALYIDSAGPTISATTIEHSGKYDLYYKGSPGGLISNCTLNSGIYLLATSSVVFTGNTFNQNNNYRTKTYAGYVHGLVNGNTFTNLDEGSYLEVISGGITKDSTWTAAIPINLDNNLVIQGTDGPDGITTLTIEPGAELRFAPGLGLQVGYTSGAPGALVAQGTATNPIVFTSNQASPAPGNWSGLYFYDTADDASRLEHCIVRYSGSLYGALYIDSAAPTISATTIEHSGKYDLYYNGSPGGLISGCTLNSGIYLMNANTVQFAGNTFHYNNSYPIKTYADNVRSLVNGNTFTNLDAGSYLEVISGSISKDSTWTAAIPINLDNNLVIQGTDGPDGITTLTIEPGAELRFAAGRGLQVGNTSGAPGALVAQGTATNPIVFTSNQTSPAPGNWTGMYFYGTADDATTKLEYCRVEYAGLYSGAIHLSDSSPKIQNTTILNSLRAGIYATGNASAYSSVNCNTFLNNQTGIYWIASPPPEISGNNFIGNANYGIYYNGAETVNCENNWWGDVLGPNQTGDKTYGNVDTDPWSLAENTCLTTGLNHPPNMPGSPYPEDNAVRVALSSGAISLNWTGGDPDLLNTVTYDLQWGDAADSLAPAAQNIVANAYQMTGLSPGVTYFWQIIARDNHGLQSDGPVWRFTTQGDPPDLIVASVSTDPAGPLQAGQSVTFTATIENVGSGPVVDPFTVDMLIDGGSLGSAAVDAVLLSGQSVPVSWTWTYTGGDPGLQINADSQAQVAETNEQNNSLIKLLSAASDMTAPALAGTSPADGAFLQQVDSISATLVDSQSLVDDAAVISGFTVTHNGQQSVAGIVSESNDTFTFTPAITSLVDGTYTVNLVAADIHGNTQNYSFAFTADSQPPAKPIITGGIISSGPLEPRPVQNATNLFIVELTGTREAGTSVWINNTERVDLGDADWSVNLDLEPGQNSIEVWLKDRAGNQGQSEWVDIQVTADDAAQYEYDAAGRVKSIYTNQQ